MSKPSPAKPIPSRSAESDSASQHNQVRELLKAFHIDDFIFEEGFISWKALSLLGEEAVEEIVGNKRGCQLVPLAQVALKQLARSRQAAPTHLRGNKAPLSPRGSLLPTPLQVAAAQQPPDAWTMQALKEMFQAKAGHQPQHVTQKLDYDDPTVLMRMQGKHV